MDKDFLTWEEKFELLENRVQFLESQLGISLTKQPKKRQPKHEPEPEMEKTINGFGKEQLRVMLSWAKSMRLDQLSKNDFDELRKWDMLKDFFPNAPERYEDIIL